jgi:hypothetical protein
MQVKWTKGGEDGVEKGDQNSRDDMNNLVKDVKGNSTCFVCAYDYYYITVS